MKKRFFILLICLVLCCQSVASSVTPLAREARADASAIAGPTAAPTDTPAPAPSYTPAPEPTDTPEATDAPEPTATPEPTPDPARPMVALTFDDGPHPLKTAPLLDLLEQYHIKATFYVLGTSLTEETSPLLQRMVDQGCEIGIHGLTHGKIDHLIPTSLTKKLLDMSAMISERVEGGYTPRTMRPPGGHLSQTVKKVTLELGISIVLWSVDTKDWKNNLDTVLKILRSKTRDGSIILCHDKGSGTQQALEIFIPELLAQGYDFVTVSELLSRHGTPAEPGAVYLCMDP